MKIYLFFLLLLPSISFGEAPELVSFLNQIEQTKLNEYNDSLKQLDFHLSKTNLKQFNEFIEIELSKIIIPHPLIKLSKKYLIDHRQFKREMQDVENKLKESKLFTNYFFKKISRDIELTIYSRNYRRIKSGQLTAMQMTPSLRSLKKKISYLEKWWPWLKSTPAKEIDQFLQNQLTLALSKLARNSRIIYPITSDYKFQVINPESMGINSSKSKGELTKILEEKDPPKKEDKKEKPPGWKPKDEQKKQDKKSYN